MSNIVPFNYIPETVVSQATPGLWNSPFSALSASIAGLNAQIGSGVTASILSDVSVGGGVFTAGPSNLSGVVTIHSNSNVSDYLSFVDSANARSNYLLGSHIGGTADGLNIYDNSGATMIVSFSKQSIRFYQNVVGPVFDVGVALASTLNAATFGGSTKTVQIQAAISAASTAVPPIARVYVPASMYPYDPRQMVFEPTVQMVREGGDWGVYDIQAYGADPTGATAATASLNAALAAAGGGKVWIPPGTFATSNLSVITTPLNVDGSGISSVLSVIVSTGTIFAFNYAGSGITAHEFGPGLRNFYLLGPGSSNTLLTAILLGGTNGAEGFLAQNLRVDSFCTAVMWDNSTYLTLFEHCAFLRNTQHLLLPATASNAGENVVWSHCVFANSSSIGSNVQVSLTGATAEFLNCSFDNAQLLMGNGVVRLVGCHFENPGWPTGFNFIRQVGGWMSLYATAFVADTSNWTNQEMVRASGGNLHASGTVALSNGSQIKQVFTVDTNQLASFVGTVRLSKITQEYGTTGSGWTVMSLGAQAGPSFVPDGTATQPIVAFNSEQSLGLYRSGVSRIGMSYGQFSLVDGTATLPAVGFSSESSLGLFRSANSQLWLSYGVLDTTNGTLSTGTHNNSASLDFKRTGTGGAFFDMTSGNQAYIVANGTGLDMRGGTGNTRILNNAGTAANFSLTDAGILSIKSGLVVSNGTVNLATGGTRLSMRTLAASAVTASAAKTNVAVDEVVFTIGGASGASLIIYSGGTAYGFNSAFSAAAS